MLHCVAVPPNDEQRQGQRLALWLSQKAGNGNKDRNDFCVCVCVFGCACASVKSYNKRNRIKELKGKCDSITTNCNKNNNYICTRRMAATVIAITTTTINNWRTPFKLRADVAR